MKTVGWQALVVVGVLGACAAVWITDALFWQRVGVLGGGGLALGGLFVGSRRERYKTENPVEFGLRELSARIAAREDDLARRLADFQGVEAYPEPLDFTRAQEPVNAGARLSELVEQDRLVDAEVELQARALFEKIRNNEYATDGVFRPQAVGDDLLAFAGRIARIYKPESGNPLLETNLNQVLQAASHTAIHMLVVLDTLPIDAAGYNFQGVYRFVQRGVRAYGTYKAASPFIDGAFHAGRLGRWALGANPLILGTSWVVGALAKKGASSLAARYMFRQGLLFLHDLVRVVAHEVANLYGAQFRQRDPNWIFGAELTALAVQLPLEREGLAQALRQINALRLRSEYDRTCLFRMLAERESARPERYEAAVLLNPSERRSIADRLVAFLGEANVHSGTRAQVTAWTHGMQERLAVSVSDVEDAGSETHETMREQCLTSLASYLIDRRGFDADEVASKLAATRSAAVFPAAKREAVLAAQSRVAAPFFEPPGACPAAIGEAYLHDLVELWLDYGLELDPHPDFVYDVASCMGHPERQTRRLLEAGYRAALARRCHGAWKPKGLASSTALALLKLLEPEESLLRVYTGARVLAPVTTLSTWLAVTDRGLFSFSTEPQPVLIWRATDDTRFVQTKARLTRGVQLIGGTWLSPTQPYDGTPILRISRPRIRAKDALRPLLAYAERHGLEATGE